MQNKNHSSRLITSILASMVAISAMSQSSGERPQLVIQIMVDQLRSDYLDLLQDYLGESGFKRLAANGACFENIDFDIDEVDLVSGTAMFVTGTYPRINGISGEYIYNPQKKAAQKILADPSKMGNFTNEKLSPAALKSSTVSDELKIHSDGLGYVYSIAPDAQQAIILAGHAGNGAFWINDINGKWSTSTFYTDVPQAISNRNYKNALSSRIDTMSWTPMMDLAKYPGIPSHKKFYPFKYIFPASRNDRYVNYKRTALVNEEVTSVALDFIESLKMGTRGETDMLNIAYSLSTYSDNAGAGSVELLDKYLRLDRQLGRLLDAIDNRVGLDKTLVVLASTGYFKENTPVDEKFRIPSGIFSPSKAKSLLNLYLMAVYGNAQWVDNYHDDYFYLNQKLIKEKGLNLKEVRNNASSFLRRMSGVAEAYSVDEIIDGPADGVSKRIYNGLIANHVGDVIVKVMPGWTISQTEDSTNPNSKHIRTAAISTPAYILHPCIKAQKITSPVDATLLAPTISRLLRIRSPNAASGKPFILE